MAGGLGFEPRQAESESAVLPLDDPPPGRCTYGARVVRKASGRWRAYNSLKCLLQAGRQYDACLAANGDAANRLAGWRVAVRTECACGRRASISLSSNAIALGITTRHSGGIRGAFGGGAFGRHSVRSFKRCPGWQQLWAILEMHGVVVVPFAAPNKAVRFEDFDDLVWNAIAPFGATFAIRLRPAPIVGM